MEEIKQIRVKTTSKIYNLAFENIFKDQLEERNKADNTPPILQELDRYGFMQF